MARRLGRLLRHVLQFWLDQLSVGLNRGHGGFTDSLKGIGVFQAYYQTHQLKKMSPSTVSWITSLEVFMMFVGVRQLQVLSWAMILFYSSDLSWPNIPSGPALGQNI